MSQFTPAGRVLPHELVDRFKWEIAAQSGQALPILTRSWGDITHRDGGHDGGRIGGSMVRVMIRQAEYPPAEGARL